MDFGGQTIFHVFFVPISSEMGFQKDVTSEAGGQKPSPLYQFSLIFSLLQLFTPG